MKKIDKYIMLALPAAIMMLGGCSSKKGADNADTASTDSMAEEVAEMSAVYEIRLDSLGADAVRIGMEVSDLYPEIEGVYDSISTENGYESNIHTFFLRGNPRFTVYEFQPGKADMIAAESRDVYVSPAEWDTLRLGDDFRKVLALPGVEASWESTDNEGMWCWHWEGIWFQPDQNALGDKLVDKLYNPGMPPRTADFENGETIGYMGTGLPW